MHIYIYIYIYINIYIKKGERLVNTLLFFQFPRAFVLIITKTKIFPAALLGL